MGLKDIFDGRLEKYLWDLGGIYDIFKEKENYKCGEKGEKGKMIVLWEKNNYYEISGR